MAAAAAASVALRIGVVSSKPEYRGDGIKYKIPIQPSRGSWMGWSGKLGFGWACQGAGQLRIEMHFFRTSS